MKWNNERRNSKIYMMYLTQKYTQITEQLRQQIYICKYETLLDIQMTFIVFCRAECQIQICITITLYNANPIDFEGTKAENIIGTKLTGWIKEKYLRFKKIPKTFRNKYLVNIHATKIAKTRKFNPLTINICRRLYITPSIKNSALKSLLIYHADHQIWNYNFWLHRNSDLRFPYITHPQHPHMSGDTVTSLELILKICIKIYSKGAFANGWADKRMQKKRKGAITLFANFMGLTWGLPGADRTQVGPMLAPWSLLYGQFNPFDDVKQDRLLVLVMLWGIVFQTCCRNILGP